MRIAPACLALVVVAGAACADKTHHLPDGGADIPPSGLIVIEPPDATVTVTNGIPIGEAYTATKIDPDGTHTDVTATATWTLADPGYGDWTGPTLSVSGHGAGPTRVQAAVGDAHGDTGLTVLVKASVLDPSAPPDAEAIFDGAEEDPGRAPLIVYPSNGILVPPNLGQFDVHWSNAGSSNLFAVSMSNDYVDIKLYTAGLDPVDTTVKFWTVFQPEQWYPIASSRQTLHLTVTGLDTADPTLKGTTPAQVVEVTNEDAKGGVYYWSPSASGIFRYDVGTPDVPAQPFETSTDAGGCVGCHALSRDGTKMAMTIGGQGGHGGVINVADKSPLVVFDGTNGAPQLNWDFAAFTGDGTKLVTVAGNNNSGFSPDGLNDDLGGTKMLLRDVNGGAVLGYVPPLPPDLTNPDFPQPYYQTHPEISPDNTLLVDVESLTQNDTFDSTGNIVIRSFDNSTNTFGTPRILVPYDPQTGQGAYYPSFSPDGQWIAFTRPKNGDGSYNNFWAESWIVKTDGSAPPVRLDFANLDNPNQGFTDSWARWVPFAQTFGADKEPLFYLTFSSQRPFGVRIPSGGRPQIWMTPVFPARAAAGHDPTGPAFRMPFQDITTTNHIAQWTQAVVPQN